MINALEIRAKAASWMINRGWKRLLAKKAGFEQSLFEHTDVELNALLTLLPILASPAHYNLLETEQQALIIGQIAHDVGKEIPEWQEYVKRGRGENPFVPHIYPQLTATVVPELVSIFNFPTSIIPDACTLVDVHMKAVRTTATMFAQLIEQGKSDRWQMLASLVDTLDNICSASGLFKTVEAIERSILSRHLSVTYHLVQMRGVSTTMLHHAAVDAFIAQGWLPLLYFSTGTIYVSGSEQRLSEPDPDQIESLLDSYIKDALPQSFEQFVVGSPLATLLPKPEFFDYRELPFYLHRAKRSVRRGSFAKKTLDKQRSTVTAYWKLCGEIGTPSESDISTQSQRIDRAQPEMVIFKLFKAAVDRSIVCRDGLPLPTAVRDELDSELERAEASGKDLEGARARYEKAIAKAQDAQWQHLEDGLRDAYDAVFGVGAYRALQGTSTLMPARDLAFTVDRYWSLPGEKFGLSVMHMGDAPDDVREQKLIEKLNSLAQNLYERLGEDARPTRASASKMASYFMADLQHPSNSQSIAALTHDHFATYQRGKLEAKRQPKATGKKGTSLLCPICNNRLQGGTPGKADFLPKPESHTNRAIAHGRPGNVVICDTCKYERFLQQLLLGEKESDVLVLLPHMNVGSLTGQSIIERANTLREQAEELLSVHSSKLDDRLTVHLTNVIYDKLKGLDPYRLTTEELLQALTYTSREDTQRGYRKALESGLREIADMEPGNTDIALLNAATGENFTSWEDALEQIVSGTVHNEMIDSVVVNTFKLQPVLKVICQTPNMLLMPVAGSFVVGKDGDSNAALRQLFILLLLGLALDCTADIVRPGDPILFEGGEGIARVPPVPALRELIGTEWISLDQAQKWLSAIGAAALLASATDYPERSNIYQILTASTPGHILRRIEQKGEGGASLRNIRLIDQVKGVLHA